MQIHPATSRSIAIGLVFPATVLALAVTVAGCSKEAKAPATAGADTWATVDGRAITRDEVEKAFRRTQDGAATLSPEEAMTMKLSILNEMILQDILLAKARALKIEVPDSELDAAYADRKKNMTDAVYEEELKKRNLAGPDMRESLRRELITKKLLDQEVVNKVAVSDQEVNDFYNANRAQFTVPEESYRIAQIVITPDRAPQQVNRTGNDATTPQEAAFKVRMVMERLKAGAQFTDVAMDYSEDPENGAARRRPRPCAGVGTEQGTGAAAQGGDRSEAGNGQRCQLRRHPHHRRGHRARAGRRTWLDDAGCEGRDQRHAQAAQGAVAPHRVSLSRAR